MNRRDLFAITAASLAARKLPAVVAPAYTLVDSTPGLKFAWGADYMRRCRVIFVDQPSRPLTLREMVDPGV